MERERVCVCERGRARGREREGGVGGGRERQIDRERERGGQGGGEKKRETFDLWHLQELGTGLDIEDRKHVIVHGPGDDFGARRIDAQRHDHAHIDLPHLLQCFEVAHA